MHLIQQSQNNVAVQVHSTALYTMLILWVRVMFFMGNVFDEMNLTAQILSEALLS